MIIMRRRLTDSNLKYLKDKSIANCQLPFSFLSIVYCLLSTISINAQTTDSLAYKQYSFINEKINKIENDSTSMSSFYEKLSRLQSTKKGRVNIAHIGDSHIQADHFSGMIRQKLQLKFGNAGRGLIFPYKVARSNEPASYKTASTSKWDAKRNVFYDNPLPIGVSGFTIESADSCSEINLTVKDQGRLGYSFTDFTLFHDKGVSNYDIIVCDESHCEKGTMRSSDKSYTPFVSEIKFDKPVRQIILENKVTDTAIQKSTRIYGMLLENDSSGILYNMIGVNGAEYRHYIMSKYFMEQLSYLNSNLIILSLGTNEAFYTNFDKNNFYNNIDTLVTSIKVANPKAAILLTTPGDSFRKARKGRMKNPDMKIARLTIVNYCLAHNLAYWDLYEIMGGYGSMAKWFTAKLAAKDRVHFNGRGYQIQGKLFYNALMDGYQNYLTNGARHK
jgi:GDSL-like Lipase/Acylhydrolase family